MSWPVSNKYIYEVQTAERCTGITFKVTLYCLSDINEDRYENINILGTRYFVLLDATFDAPQVLDTSVHLIFPALLWNICDEVICDKKQQMIILLIWLLDLFLKHIDKFKLRQQSIPSAIYMFKVSKINPNNKITKQKQNTRTICQIYSKLTIKTPEQCLGPLLLTLNIFLTLFYGYYCWIQTKSWLSLRNYSFR